jgi:murein DD-endopeptidase MepM/ murein hydrolase activator NlpD
MTVGKPTRDKANILKRVIDHLFPVRQIVVRTQGRVAHRTVPQGLQVACAVGMVATVGWCAFATVSFVLHDRIVEAKNNQIANARLAYSSLLTEVANYQNRFQALTHDLENNHVLMLDLIEQNATLQRSLTDVREELINTEGQRQEVAQARESLRTELFSIESELRELAGRNFSLKDNLVTVESDLQSALSERNAALLDASQAKRRASTLERELDRINASQREVFARLGEAASDAVADMERVIEMTGLDLAALLPERDTGQGGPFVSSEAATPAAGDLAEEVERLDGLISRSRDLEVLLRKLPLTLPLDTYSITSTFGKRKDPINKRWAMHYGLDMGAPFRSKVRVTAPGVVTHAGWKGKYGKLVEIDHGYGVKTRYGHLHKVKVEKGQEVSFRDIIGLLGSTGRSTGAHLHYEVVFDGTPVNPMRFANAGRNVFKIEDQ